MEEMVGEQMPAGYRQMANPDDVARAVLAASTWAGSNTGIEMLVAPQAGMPSTPPIDAAWKSGVW